MDYTSILKDFGPLIGVILFFIWRDWKREEGLVERVEVLEEYQRETLVKLIKTSTEVIASNTQQLKWMANIISNCNTGKNNG
jgi:hypothetical protein